MSMFKQKLSFRTQVALAELISDVKEVANDNQPEATNQWQGGFVLWYTDADRYPRLAIYMDHSVPGAGYGQWWTRTEDGELVADDDLPSLMNP